ncbi:MAG: sugar phosphate isomerase/epimerase [Planctomycetaceae bacterium]|nr:sugar phosphate isomerase/epimerase [Planctomycetaceae bacterium]
MLTSFSVATADTQLPLRQALRAVAQLPVQQIRCDARTELIARQLTQTGIREFLHLVKEVGLTLSALNFMVRHPFTDKNNLDARVAATLEAMQLAAKLKVRALCIKIGEIPAEDSPAFPLLKEVIEDLARQGNHLGVVLTVIPIGKSIERLQTFLQHVRSGPIAIDFDPSRFLLGETDPLQALRELRPFIQQFTARDAVRDFSGGGQEVQLGRGEIAWDEMIATLDEVGYRGPIHVSRTGGENRIEDLDNAVAYLKNIAGEFG